ncbi:glycosyltransferase [Brucella anthropi]|uniref:glycosyltransferase n=1 Tax=Brucella TaxID=234 RepID=UPI00141D89D0|nr:MULTISPECIES: glycosyltransferase [Brucella/Ochrobactrum group]QTN01916.1 glycosyltransferase [Ochrobactrum sp. EEELCW01]MBA8859555.1 glycosyltransferase involved in cell wall biosynthesis [Brucella anthropi]NIH76275.1 glycosyltransferase involved in cell wall biosynthesis [Ochrobactrum sp. P20RRXII]QPA28778.1 glycosyltransferase [Brucella anthropi]WKT95628.1 glycosyltransferase [Brucella anthropi]
MSNRKLETDRTSPLGAERDISTDVQAENATLNATIDLLLNKLSKIEAAYRDELTRAIDRADTQERRANQAIARLQQFELSEAWRIVSALNTRLNRFPKLRITLLRAAKVAHWTTTGQLRAKYRQYKLVRQFEKSTTDIAEPDGGKLGFAYPVNQSGLPAPLLDEILTFMKSNGSIDLLMAINFYAGGGAESAALEYAKAYASKNVDKSALIVLTDGGPKRPLPEMPSNILIVDLNDWDVIDAIHREELLYLIFRAIPLHVFHIINSVTAYNFLKKLPSRFLSDIDIIASVFALQFDPDDNTKIIGYAQDFLPPNIDKIDNVVTDNLRFSIEGPLKIGITEHSKKFITVYNKSKLDGILTVKDSIALSSKRKFNSSGGEKLKVIWAGRLDKEKRVDLLIEVAKITEEFCDFYVFGGAVVDGGYEAELNKLKNLVLSGPYENPVEWDQKVLGNVFLFTSVWEGMPNTVIEASYLGYPIVASDVGGVSELITPSTGWAVDRFASAKFYAEALREIYADHAEVENRTKRLIDLVHSRHNENAYLKSLCQVPGYTKLNQ